MYCKTYKSNYTISIKQFSEIIPMNSQVIIDNCSLINTIYDKYLKILLEVMNSPSYFIKPKVHTFFHLIINFG